MCKAVAAKMCILLTIIIIIANHTALYKIKFFPVVYFVAGQIIHKIFYYFSATCVIMAKIVPEGELHNGTFDKDFWYPL